jgi:hypothetical protein
MLMDNVYRPAAASKNLSIIVSVYFQNVSRMLFFLYNRQKPIRIRADINITVIKSRESDSLP